METNGMPLAPALRITLLENTLKPISPPRSAPLLGTCGYDPVKPPAR